MIADRIFEWARTQPHKIALIDNEVPWSYAEFAGRIGAARTFFKGCDLQSGADALILMPLSEEAWVCLLALHSLGLSTACVADWATAKGLPKRDFACIVTSPGNLRRVPSVRDAHANAKVIVIPQWPRSGLEVPQSGISSSEFGNHMLLTSGTTGTSKAVLVPGAYEDARCAARGKCMLLDHDTILNNMDYPMWTGAGFKDPLTIWYLGATIIFDQRPARLNRLFDHEPTRMFLTPACLGAATGIFQDRKEDVTDRRCTISISSGPVSMNAMRNALETLSRRIVTHWSATEIMTFPLASDVRQIDDMLWLSVANERVVQVVDESGTECPVGQEGELRIQLMDMDCTSYLNDEAATARHFRHGFFYPGDIAVRRADGKFRVLGRIDDVLNMGGTKLPVVPLEQDVQKFLNVDNVCLFAGLNDQGFEELVIVIETDRLPSPELLGRAAKRFDAFERVRFAALKEFPRTEMGMQKIKRAEVRRLAGNRAARK